MAKVVHASKASLNIRALCETCDAVMHRRVATTQLSEFLAYLDISIEQAQRDIGETVKPCQNDYSQKGQESHAKASPQE